jgi:hypothetical protein
MPGYLFVFIILLKNKKIKELMYISVITVITFLIIGLPFVIYFLYTDSWSDFKFCYWDFNRAYSDTSFLKVLIRTVKRLWFSVIGDSPVHALLFVCFIGIIINFRHLKYKTETCFFIFTIVLTCIMISLGKYNFRHYYLLCLPIFAFPYAIVFQYLKQNFIANPKIINSILIFFLIYGGVNESSKVINNYRYSKSKIGNLITFIKENSEETDKIAVVGSECWVYSLSGRESVSKYSYQFPIVSVNQYGTMIAESYMKDIINEKPRIIVTNISNSNYRSYFKGLGEILDTQYEKYSSNDIRLCCWVRKQ